MSLTGFTPQLKRDIRDEANKLEANERSSILICAVGSKKQIFRVEGHCGCAQLCAHRP